MSAVIDIQERIKDSSEIKRIFELQEKHKLELRYSTAEQRIATLEKLKVAIDNNKERIYQAAHNDFRKPRVEAALAEVFPIINGINYAQKNLKKWMKTQRIRGGIATFGIRSEIHYEPKGASLIISPWNYPFMLTFQPLTFAIAAGCTAIVKPSEMTPNMSALISEIIEEVFDEKEVAVFEGAAEVAQNLLALPFDHIFFTGSPQLGKIVMAAAAKNLTSVTLELGGKSPVIIDETADIQSAAERVAWGKFVNCGQTCVAPDHVFIHESRQAEFVTAIKAIIEARYDGEDSNPETSPDFARIVNDRHAERVASLIDDAVQKGAVVEIGAKTNLAENYIAPTILTNVDKEQSEIMKDEIFGPVIPTMTYTDLGEIVDFINAREKPLALYLFSNDKANIERVTKGTSSGGLSVNNVMIHAMSPKMPFGGVNNSGIGKSNGHYGFMAFSHDKAVGTQTSKFSMMQKMAPPYTPRLTKVVNFMIKHFA